MPGKTDLSKLNCSLARSLAAAGDWWTLLIVRDAFMGLSRFGEFRQSLGIARNILAQRLTALTAEGILEAEGPPRRPRYRLTQKGREMMPALVALMQWGDKWQSENRPPVILTGGDGEALAPVRVVSRKGKPVAELRFTPGPGANARTRQFFERLSLSR